MCVAGSLHRRWKTPRGAGPSIWFLDLPWGDWSVAIDVASATWQVSACWHSERQNLKKEEGCNLMIFVYVYNHRRIRKANGQNMIHACRWFIILWPAEISSACVFCFFFSEVFNAKQRLGQKPVASVANEIGDQKHGHHEARFPSQLLDLLLAIYQPPVSWLRWPTWAPTKGCDQRLSQTSFADVYRQSSCLTTVTTF